MTTQAHPRPTDRPRSVAGAVVRWCAQVCAWVVILLSLAALSAAVLVPRLGGATPYEILTSSMEPGMPPGTLVVVRPVDHPSSLRVGSVITYQLHSGQPTVVTHRVIEVGSNLKGELRIHTQGDANDVADALWVRPEQIRGELWYAVPHLGRANQVLNGGQRQSLIYLAAGALLLYAVWMYLAAVVTRRSGRWARGRKALAAMPAAPVVATVATSPPASAPAAAPMVPVAATATSPDREHERAGVG